VGALKRPYPVTGSMVVFALLVPVYIFIAESLRGRTLHAPAMALDRLVPVLAMSIGGLLLVVLAGFWVVFRRSAGL
jgi:hypothetical protein